MMTGGPKIAAEASHPSDWDAATYDRIADPMTRWGATVLERLSLRGQERVLDAGCGSGRVTAELSKRLPRGSVIALDLSAAMLAEARCRLAPLVRERALCAPILPGPYRCSAWMRSSRQRRSTGSLTTTPFSGILPPFFAPERPSSPNAVASATLGESMPRRGQPVSILILPTSRPPPIQNGGFGPPISPLCAAGCSHSQRASPRRAVRDLPAHRLPAPSH